MEFASLRPLVVYMYTLRRVSAVPSAARPNRKTVARALPLFSFHGSGYGRFNSSFSSLSPFFRCSSSQPVFLSLRFDPSSLLLFLNSGFEWRYAQSLFDNAVLRVIESRYTIYHIFSMSYIRIKIKSLKWKSAWKVFSWYYMNVDEINKFKVFLFLRMRWQ